MFLRISQGLAADWGVVVANLIVEQQNFGPHVFLVVTWMKRKPTTLQQQVKG